MVEFLSMIQVSFRCVRWSSRAKHKLLAHLCINRDFQKAISTIIPKIMWGIDIKILFTDVQYGVKTTYQTHLCSAGTDHDKNKVEDGVGDSHFSTGGNHPTTIPTNNQ